MCVNCLAQQQAQNAKDLAKSGAGVAVSGYEVVFSADHQSNVLALVGGAKWDDAVITYSFPNTGGDYVGSGQSASSYGSGEAGSGFAELTTTQQQATREIFDMFSELLDVTFTELTGSDDKDAMIRFGQSAVPSTAWAYYPAASDIGGDVWLGTGAGYYTNPAKGTYANHTLMHEIGHALGLKHGHEATGHGALSDDKDGMAYSLMTYNSHIGSSSYGYTNEYWGYAQSAMQYDMAALQALYGANTTTNSGDTVYTFSKTTGAMSIDGVAQDAPGSNRIFKTLWDAGGRDLIDLRNYSDDAVINLNEGGALKFSNIQTAQVQAGVYAEGNLYLGLDPDSTGAGLIEDVRTGGGDDTIIGNQVKNKLAGKGGADELHGGAGHDVLKGNGGADFLFGGDGIDRLDGGLGRDILTGGAGTDVFWLREQSNVDRVRDFEVGVDRIRVEDMGLVSLDSNEQGHLVVDYGSGNARLVLQQVEFGDATLSELVFT